MRKNKNEPNNKKKEKPIIKKSIQEQIAKNAEDIEIIKNQLNEPIINKIETQKYEKNIGNHSNKFNRFCINSKNKFNKYQSNKEFKDISSTIKSIKILEEKILNDNENKINS